MGSILNLCEKVIWLHNGEIKLSGSAKHVSEAYLQFSLQEVYGKEICLSDTCDKKEEIKGYRDPKKGDQDNYLDYNSQFNIRSNIKNASGWKTGAGEVVSVEINRMSPKEGDSTSLSGGELVQIVIVAKLVEYFEKPILGFIVRDRLGQDLFGENTLPFTKTNPFSVKPDSFIRAEISFYLPMLPNGSYSIMVSLADGDLTNHIQHHWLHDAAIFNVLSSKVRYGLVGCFVKDISMRTL